MKPIFQEKSRSYIYIYKPLFIRHSFKILFISIRSSITYRKQIMQVGLSFDNSNHKNTKLFFYFYF